MADIGLSALCVVWGDVEHHRSISHPSTVDQRLRRRRINMQLLQICLRAIVHQDQLQAQGHNLKLPCRPLTQKYRVPAGIFSNAVFDVRVKSVCTICSVHCPGVGEKKLPQVEGKWLRLNFALPSPLFSLFSGGRSDFSKQSHGRHINDEV